MVDNYPVPVIPTPDHDKALHDLLGIDHGLLDGVADDDHPQYLNAARHDNAAHSTVDHHALAGLTDDDHTQYFNVARHDAHDHTAVLGDYLPLAGGTLTGPLLLPDGSDANPALAFANGTNTGLKYSLPFGFPTLSGLVNGSRVFAFQQAKNFLDVETSLEGNKLINVADPTDDQDAANKAYVDSGDAAPGVDMQVAGTGVNSSTLDGSFQDVASTTYGIPTGWNTYTLKARGWTMVANLTDGDTVETAIVIDSVAGLIIGDNATAKSRTLTAAKISTGLSTNVTVALRARNTSGTRGVSYSAWLDLIAVRTS